MDGSTFPFHSFCVAFWFVYSHPAKFSERFQTKPIYEMEKSVYLREREGVSVPFLAMCK